MTDTFEQLEDKVIAWAKARQIIPNSTVSAQLKKLEEERIETEDALTMMAAEIMSFEQVIEDFGLTPDLQKDIDSVTADIEAEIKDGFGDMLVCLINAAALADVSLTDALAHAYDQIKDRTGTLGPDGIFYKDQP